MNPDMLSQLEAQMPLLIRERGLSGLLELDRKGFDDLGPETRPAAVARRVQDDALALVMETLEEGYSDLPRRLSELVCELLRYVCGRVDPAVEMIVLGSVGAGEFCLSDPVELLLISPERNREITPAFMHFWSALNIHGFRSELVRPFGGLLMSKHGFEEFEVNSMEMRQRLDMVNARALGSSGLAEQFRLKAIEGTPLTPDHLAELMQRKRQVESMYVQAKHWHRHLVYGYGSLSDITWLIGLLSLRDPSLLRTVGHGTRDRLRALASSQLLNAVELEILLEGHAHLLELRTRLYLLGYPMDIIPENPDKLDRLARSYGLERGNDVLRKHEPMTEAIRRTYNETIGRLKV